ncbi:MAG: DUF6378 domain-containing protein [Pseudomonadota bacterium]
MSNPIHDEFFERVKATLGDRDNSYGDARTMCNGVAAMWTEISDNAVFHADDVPKFMIAMKLMRLHTDNHHTDSMIDIAGYAAILYSLQHSGKGKTQ